MSKCKNLLAIITELSSDAQLVDSKSVEKVQKLICNAKRIFLAGAGRSGFAARAFSNRLMHLGYTVYFVGEPTTPSIQKGDLLIIGSGSGETGSLVTMAQKAHKQGAKIATLTIFPENTIGKLASACIKIPGMTAKSDSKNEKAETVQPLGSSFEQLSWLVYDSMINELKKITGQSDDKMNYRHAKLE